MIRAPRWTVENKGDCSEIIKKGVARGQSGIKVEAVVPEGKD